MLNRVARMSGVMGGPVKATRCSRLGENRQRMEVDRQGAVSSLSFAAAVILLIGFGASCASHGAHLYQSTSEPRLRQLVLNSVQPRFPSTLEPEDHRGVVVASVEVRPTGQVTVLAIEEAPHRLIGEEVTASIEQWQFGSLPPDEVGDVLPLRGKLTFYCVVEAGQGHIVSAEMP